jgi:hypothetical protein
MFIYVGFPPSKVESVCTTTVNEQNGHSELVVGTNDGLIVSCYCCKYYIYTYMYLYIYMYIYIYVYIERHIYTHIHTYTLTYEYIFIQIYIEVAALLIHVIAVTTCILYVNRCIHICI